MLSEINQTQKDKYCTILLDIKSLEFVLVLEIQFCKWMVTDIVTVLKSTKLYTKIFKNSLLWIFYNKKFKNKKY